MRVVDTADLVRARDVRVLEELPEPRFGDEPPHERLVARELLVEALERDHVERAGDIDLRTMHGRHPADSERFADPIRTERY